MIGNGTFIIWQQLKKSEAVIADGLTLQQTSERVKMPEFEGYALRGWVHPGLNVPAAYKDSGGE